MTSKFLQLGVSALFAASVPTVAQAQPDHLVDQTGFDKVLEIAKGFGTAEREDFEGRPRIEGRMDGTLYSIDFWDCDDDFTSCRTIVFSAWWDFDDGQASLEKVNAWNASATFGRGYVDDEGDVWVELGFNLNFGVHRRNFDDTFDWWKVVVSDFRERVIEAE